MDSFSEFRGNMLDVNEAVCSPPPGARQSTHLVPLGDSLASIISIGKSIEDVLNISADGSHKELANVVHTSVIRTQGFLSEVSQVSVDTKARTDDLFRYMKDALAHLQDRRVNDKRAKIKNILKRLIGLPKDSPPAHHLKVQNACDALEATLPVLDCVPTIIFPSSETKTPRTLSDGRPRENDAADGKIAERYATDAPEKSRWRTTAVDGVESGLRILSGTTSFMPSTAGSIVKLMAGTGLAIIEMLKDMEDNKEQAMELGRHIGTLIQTAARFLEGPTDEDEESEEDEGSDDEMEGSDDEQTIAQLKSFAGVLKALEKALAGLTEQGRLQRAISHKSNKDDLKKWDVKINRAFVALQTQLSLHSLRLLTNLDAVDALRERDRLIGLLGDGDTGATEKAADPADLMCLPGTRMDVLERVDHWIVSRSGSRVFWISGVAGCGKSAVAATIARRQHSIPGPVAIFHFARGNQDRNRRVICALSRQLARLGHGSMERFILNSLKIDPDIATSHLTTQFHHLIVEPLKKIVPGSLPVVLVLDGLDEWDNQDATAKLVSLIGQVHTELPPTVRFILTSQNEPHLVRSLEQFSIQPMVTRYPLDGVQKTDTARDIRAYVEMRLAKIRDQSGIVADARSWPEVGSVTKLVELSGGLFQWASTAMTHIEAKSPRTRLDDILGSPETYTGLDGLYQGVLASSFQDERRPSILRLLQDVLGSILLAVVPINVDTIAQMCCKSLDDLPKTAELIQHEILASLGSLLLVSKDRALPITVSHPSVIDFLTNLVRCTNKIFYIDIIDHHTRMLWACLRLMEQDLKHDICRIGNASKTNDEIQDAITEYVSSGLRYSCQHWSWHLLRSGHSASISVELRARIGRFSRTLLLGWLEVLSLIGVPSSAVSIAQDIALWLSDCPQPHTADMATQLWNDCACFVAMFPEPIATSAAQIYLSAFRLAPTETRLVRRYAGTVKRGLRVIRGPVEKGWPASACTSSGSETVANPVDLSPGAERMALGSGDKIEIHPDMHPEVPKGKVPIGHTGNVQCLSFSPDGRTIASGSEDKTARLWDATTGASKAGPLVGHTDWVRCILFSPNGRIIASGSYDHTVRLWDAELGLSVAEALIGHAARVRCLAFSPDSKVLASGSDDGSVRMWDVVSGTSLGPPLVWRKGLMRSLGFSANGRKVIATILPGLPQEWDVPESPGQVPPVLQGLVTCPKPVSQGWVSPSGWIYRLNARWLWLPFTGADWLLCESRLVLRQGREVYIIDVSEILYE